MTNNNRKITWKAIVAVVLVMASLFAMSSLVNAGIVELILGEEYAEVAAAASEESSEPKPLRCTHPIMLYSHNENCANNHENTVSVSVCMTSGCPYVAKSACQKCLQNAN